MKICQINKKYFFFVFFIVASSIVADFALADAYELQVPLGDITSVEVGAGTDGLAVYLATIYKFAISAVGIVAVVVMTFGGFLWITAFGNGERVSNAKSYISAALSGLVLALCSWTILWLVNPALVSFNSINISNLNTSSVSEGNDKIGCCFYEDFSADSTLPVDSAFTSVSGKCQVGGVYNSNQVAISNKCVDYQLADQETRNKIKAAGITPNKENCINPNQTSCTSFYLLPQRAVDGVTEVCKGVSNCVITGGTEAGHGEHGQGLAVLDLRICQSDGNGGCVSRNNALVERITSLVELDAGQTEMDYDRKTNRYTANDGSFDLIMEKNSDGSEHFHVRFQ